MVDAKTSITEAFRIADDVLRQGIGGISDLITKPGIINLDFADVKTIMQDAGSALMAIGHGSGETRCIDAAKEAIESPLLEMNIQGATGVLYNITGGTNLTLIETSEAAEIIRAAVDEDAEIIYGTSIDQSLGDAVTHHPDRHRVRDRHDIDDVFAPPPRRPRPRARAGARARPRARPRPGPPPPLRRDRPPAPPRPPHQRPLFPDDDWVSESSIIKFLRER